MKNSATSEPGFYCNTEVRSKSSTQKQNRGKTHIRISSSTEKRKKEKEEMTINGTPEQENGETPELREEERGGMRKCTYTHKQKCGYAEKGRCAPENKFLDKAWTRRRERFRAAAPEILKQRYANARKYGNTAIRKNASMDKRKISKNENKKCRRCVMRKYTCSSPRKLGAAKLRHAGAWTGALPNASRIAL